MRISFIAVLLTIFSIISFQLSAQTSKKDTSAHKPATKHLFIDVHRLGPGNVKYEAVAEAHAKDMAVEGKYGVKFLKYWVDEDKGLIYCLSSATDSVAIRKTHAEAHGLLPESIYMVTAGKEEALKGKNALFLDVHYVGAGKVTAKDVAAAHQKDLATESKYGVNIINYWLDEKKGVIMCLAEAKDAASIISTHREAHGLVPADVMKVKQGQ